MGNSQRGARRFGIFNRQSKLGFSRLIVIEQAIGQPEIVMGRGKRSLFQLDCLFVIKNGTLVIGMRRGSALMGDNIPQVVVENRVLGSVLQKAVDSRLGGLPCPSFD